MEHGWVEYTACRFHGSKSWGPWFDLTRNQARGLLGSLERYEKHRGEWRYQDKDGVILLIVAFHRR